MKSIALLLAVVITCSSLYAFDHTKLEQFKDKLATALTNKDLKALNLLYYTNGASQYEIDNDIYSYEYNFNHYAFDKIEIQSLSDLKINSDAASIMTKGITIYGHSYVPNLTPEALCTVMFIGKIKDRSVSAGSASPIGVDPDGNVKIILSKISN